MFGASAAPGTWSKLGKESSVDMERLAPAEAQELVARLEKSDLEARFGRGKLSESRAENARLAAEFESVRAFYQDVEVHLAAAQEEAVRERRELDRRAASSEAACKKAERALEAERRAR
ncbi:hypothetical protein H632_c174p2, partial [Helicosporidium sp. ATCC 50920]